MRTTSRTQQRYDHRLRDLVKRTGDLTIATDLGVPRSTAELPSRTSLTTSALSRDTISVQAAGAGSQKPRVGGGGRTSIVGQRVPVVHASTLACVSQHQRRCCPPNISSVTTDHDDLCELPSMGGGSPIHSAGHSTLDHVRAQAFPHTGITASLSVIVRDGRTRRTRSDRVTKSRAGCPACVRPRRELCRVPSVAACADRTDATPHRAGRHGSPPRTTGTGARNYLAW